MIDNHSLAAALLKHIAVQHYGFGGAIGDAIGGALSNPDLTSLSANNPIIGGVLGGPVGALSGSGMAPAVGNILTNPAKGLTVQNGIQGQVPDITKTDFAPDMNQATSGISNGQTGMAQAIGNLGGFSTAQGALGNALASQAPGSLQAKQSGLAGDLHNTASKLDTTAGAQGAIGSALASQGPGSIQAQQNGLAGDLRNTASKLDTTAVNQNSLASQIGGLAGNGAGQLGNVVSQQQTLANALSNQAQGHGPNPAQAQFQQNADQLARQQAGAIASEKGLSPALQAKMIAEQTAGAGQGIAGQAATLQAQQQLAAQQGLAQQQSSMANTIGQQAGVLGAGTAAFGNAANTLNDQAGALSASGNQLANQVGTNAAASGVLAQNASTLNDQTGALTASGGQLSNQVGTNTAAGNILAQGANTTATQGTLSSDAAAAGNTELGNAISGQSAQNSAINSGSLGAQGLTAQGALANQSATEGTQAGMFNAAGQGLSTAAKMFSQGGAVSHYDMGGGIDPITQSILAGVKAPTYAPVDFTGSNDKTKAAAPPAQGLAAGGTVDTQALSLARTLMAQGGTVPGRDPVPGKNSPKNDIVPAALSPNEVVLPLSVTQGKNPGELAKDFVDKLKAKAHPTYGHVLKARQALAKAEEAHRRCMGGKAA